ncbi:hypothetical protein VTK73DRAFT_7692 [Phialemonium thermophilum]|uniref:Uncharacterized protein n=1 Tax=Phialemonium thermophilum TaxID=223376 RepID=A0ABR3XRJ2_9PEZI
MKGRPVDQLVFEHIFPKSRPSDPIHFQAFLQQCLIPEVRQEVRAFYGHINTPEAKYPGLDYCHPTHRIRLSRWPWHRRLFRAFDDLGLTPNEIAGLTKWEGTKWAKERYERDHGVTIRDTTADGFADWVEPEDRAATRQREPTPARSERRRDAMAEMADSESEGELESVGADLNDRLRARVNLRILSGDPNVPLDEEWEQWLKHIIETGGLSSLAQQIAGVPDTVEILVGTRRPVMPGLLQRDDATAPPSSAGLLRSTVTRSIQEPRRTFSDLHLPSGEGGSTTAADMSRQRAAPEPRA